MIWSSLSCAVNPFNAYKITTLWIHNLVVFACLPLTIRSSTSRHCLKNAPVTCSWLWTTLQRRARPFSNHAVTSAVTALSALWYANVSRIGRCTNWQWPYHRALVSTSSRHNRAKQQLHIEHMLIKVDKNHGNELRPTNRKMRCHWGDDKTHRIYMNTKCDLWYNQYWCFFNM